MEEALRTLVRKLADERGAAVVEMVFAVPVVVVLAAAVSDIGLYMASAMEADSYATAACRYIMDNPELVEAGADAAAASAASYLERSYSAAVTAGAAASGQAQVSVSVSFQGGRSSAQSMREDYTYTVYPNGIDEAWRTSSRVYVPFSVRVTENRPFTTALGSVASSACGNAAGSCEVSSTQSGAADRTDGATW